MGLCGKIWREGRECINDVILLWSQKIKENEEGVVKEKGKEEKEEEEKATLPRAVEK